MFELKYWTVGTEVAEKIINSSQSMGVVYVLSRCIEIYIILIIEDVQPYCLVA